MTIRDQVFTVLKKKPGTPQSIKGVADALPEVSYESVANSLADLAIFDERVERTARGVYVYYNNTHSKTAITAVAPSDMPKLERTIAKAADVFEEPEPEENPEDGRYFTQVGVAENGDIIISRDSDTKAYRATPL